MDIKKLYFDEELMCWEDLANFFENNLEIEHENDFEKTKELLDKLKEVIYINEELILTKITYKGKTRYMLEDMGEEIGYIIEI